MNVCNMSVSFIAQGDIVVIVRESECSVCLSQSYRKCHVIFESKESNVCL